MDCEHRNSIVLDSRTREKSPLPRRRRKCLDCDYRFTTVEITQEESPENLHKEIARLRAKLIRIKSIVE